MQKCIVIVLGIFVCGCAVEENGDPSQELNPAKIRQRFEPLDSKETGRGANWTALAEAPERPGAFWLRAHAGVGDTFPVQEASGPKLFDVAIPEGNDEKLLVDIRYQGGVQRIEVPRDTPVTVEIGGRRYEWHYPSLYVNPESQATSDKAFLILTRLPRP